MRRSPIQVIILIMLLSLFTTQFSMLHVGAQPLPDWRDTEPVRVVVRSTSDWGRILFDDLNGTNSNGIRLKSVLGSGFVTGQDSGYSHATLDVGRKIPWPAEVYNQIEVRHGDMFGFFKGLGNFRFIEAYADVVLEFDVSTPQSYVWLMSGGNGTTTFQIVSPSTGGTVWRDLIIGQGHTEEVRRVMTPQPFFHPGRSESLVVVTWLIVAIVAIILLNLPVIELLHRRVKRARARSKARGET
ncbi:MAG TPA: hypothetical protein VJZ75_06910 [Candidatus Bathyarchaeia archaeon]|nr:hypothetical protein [Candidatus Bathyarchaeia archaeon]